MSVQDMATPQEAAFKTVENQPPSAKENTFYIGLCMAGAVSAGAYTAGVMDYLIEALQKWEGKRGQPGVPTHRVEIPVIGGASAGGMTGIVTAAILNQEIKPVEKTLDALMEGQPQNPLYHIWVDLTGDKDMFAKLLSNDDIKKENTDTKKKGTIYSLLNAEFIKEIADKHIVRTTGKWVDRPYFSKQLRVFATLSNLKGFTRSISFSGAAEKVRKYFITRHNDYACFIMDTTKNPSPFSPRQDGWFPISFGSASNDDLDLLRTAAMATGAFPVGLRAREVKRQRAYVQGMELLKEEGMDADEEMDEPYNMDFVDGGLINNEPFDKVRDVLLSVTGQKEPINNKEKAANKEKRHDHKEFKGTVLMIDPFPSTRNNFKPGSDLFTVISHTLSAMIGHLRIKSKDILDAMNKEKAGQFLIAPSRILPDSEGESIDGSKAIACGCLEGFGGFLHKEFRIHDFLLGRANCEAFLRKYFTVPAGTTNPIFAEGYEKADKSRFSAKDGTELQIIPIFDSDAKDQFDRICFPGPKGESPSNWPVRIMADVEKYDDAIRKRSHAIITTLAKGTSTSWRARAVIWLAARWTLNRKLSNLVQKKIKAALIKHQLLLGKDGKLIQPDAKASVKATPASQVPDAATGSITS